MISTKKVYIPLDKETKSNLKGIFVQILMSRIIKVFWLDFHLYHWIAVNPIDLRRSNFFVEIFWMFIQNNPPVKMFVNSYVM